MNLDLQKVLPAEAFETEQNEGDYIGKDGLLYCGVCRTKKQTRLPASDFTGGREIIVPCICKCKVEENKRKEEEEKKRQEMQRLERLKASSLMDAKLKAARLDGYQVDGDNQKIYNLAGNYVKRFDEMYEKRQGLLFWGTVGTGKSYTAACIANELLDQMIPVVMTSFVKILQNIQGNPDEEEKLQPLDCSMLPRDYVIREDSKVQVIPIKSAEAQYYRELWTHNFVGSSATFNRALLIDGYVAGVFGISKMAADSVFVWYVMKVPHKTYRLGRLCYMLAQNRDFVDTLLDNIEQEKVTKMRTAMLTRYPENKEVRGIMKLVNRVEDKKNGYKLTYEAELVEGRTEQQTLQEWLRRENEWQKNRAKASSKSKDAK